MRSVVIFGAKESTASLMPSVEIDGLDVRTGLVHLEDAAFSNERPEYRHSVLVRVKAFSCNYRDKQFIGKLQEHSAERFTAIGSEFSGEVIDTGTEVSTLEIGDRVMSNHHYTGAGIDADGVREGIPTNQGSKELQILNERKLVRIPEQMSDVDAAGFGLNAQTAYGMARRLALEPGMNLLVTSARSNTSLFTISALKNHDINVYACTTSKQFADQIRQVGAKEVIVLSREDGSIGSLDGIHSLAKKIGLFDRVVDPFYNLHLYKVVPLLKPFGMYISCGLAVDLSKAGQVGVKENGFHTAMGAAIMKNLSIMGNCLGLTEDLERSLVDFASGKIEVPIDSVFSGEQTNEFLYRTFSDRERFGKVVYTYD